MRPIIQHVTERKDVDTMTLIEELVTALEKARNAMSQSVLYLDDCEYVDSALKRASALQIDQNRAMVIDRVIEGIAKAQTIETLQEYGADVYYFGYELMPHREYNGRDTITIHLNGRRKLNGKNQN